MNDFVPVKIHPPQRYHDAHLLGDDCPAAIQKSSEVSTQYNTDNANNSADVARLQEDNSEFEQRRPQMAPQHIQLCSQYQQQCSQAQSQEYDALKSAFDLINSGNADIASGNCTAALTSFNNAAGFLTNTAEPKHVYFGQQATLWEAILVQYG